MMVALLTSCLGASPKVGEVEPAPLLPLERAWTFTLDGIPANAGAMDGERVYLALRGGGLLAVDSETGVGLWSQSVEAEWPPLVAMGHLFVAAAETVRALDVRTGAELWATRASSPVSAPLAWDGSGLVVSTDSGAVLRIRGATGEVTWRTVLGSQSRHPAVRTDGGLVVLALDDSRVVALTAESGLTRWERRLGGTLSAPAVARNRVLVGSTTNLLWALNPEDGDEEWRWRVGADVVGAASDGDTVYLASLDNALRAVNRGNGNQRWKANLSMRPALPPLVLDGIVLVVGVSPRVETYVGKTGTVQGTHVTSSDLVGAPLLAPAPLRPYRVAMVTVTREGDVTGLRPEQMLMRDPPLEPVSELPGRALVRERIPTRARGVTTSSLEP